MIGPVIVSLLGAVVFIVGAVDAMREKRYALFSLFSICGLGYLVLPLMVIWFELFG